MNQKAELISGASCLNWLLSHHGFTFVIEREGNGSGDGFCTGAFVRGKWRLELHFRSSLGLVSYQVGDLALSHGQYLRAQGAEGQYPGFWKTPRDAFKYLLQDLIDYGQPFFSKDTSEFEKLTQMLANSPNET